MEKRMITFTLDHDKPPKVSAARKGALKALAERPESEIDYSDIPQRPEEYAPIIRPNPFYKPVKTSTTVRIDSDVLYWLKRAGPGYQSRINAILRREMLAAHKVTTK